MTKGTRLTSGSVISSFCFGGVGLWLISEASAADAAKSVLLYLCAACCIAGAFRIPIAAALRQWHGD
jgi:hypothetical protein